MSDRASRRRPEETCGGFTLLELIVVMFLVTMASALVVTRVHTGSSRPLLDVTTAKLTAQLRAARADVLKKGVERTVAIDLDRRVHWSDLQPDPTAIDPRISVAIMDDTLEWDGRLRRVRFRPDGTATGARILLTDGASQARIDIDWLTGATKFVTGH